MSPVFFPIRHLSPAGAVCLNKLLDEIQPDCILIEGPSDLNKHIPWICHPDTRFPIAIVNYTLQEPVVSLLYPYAEYSPELVAMQWASRHHIKCRFMDLPASVFLYDAVQRRLQGESFSTLTDKIIYRLKSIDNEDYESLWEYYFEQQDDTKKYYSRVLEFGTQIRTDEDENYTNIQQDTDQFREPWMKREIIKALHEGISPDKLVCVCGAYHVKGLQTCDPISDERAQALPSADYDTTLMPYAYERLSSQSGYGAGNEFPAYYEMLYHALKNHTLDDLATEYIVKVARSTNNTMISPAEVIDASKLAMQLASVRNRNRPVLRDLQDAVMTTMGHHSEMELAKAMYRVEIGDKIGYLPQDAINTPLQQDFKRQIQKLDLVPYHTSITKTLRLDLRENIHAQDETKSYLDLERSCLLHRLRILNIPFGIWNESKNNTYDPKETWQIAWSLSTDMRLVDASMLGDTIENACNRFLSEKSQKANDLKQIIDILQDVILAKLTDLTESIIRTIQSMAVDSTSFKDIAQTAFSLSEIVQFGSIRNFHNHYIMTIIEQLYTRACLIVESACHCNSKIEPDITNAIHLIQKISNRNLNLNTSPWYNSLLSIAESNSVNSKCSGFATAILIESGFIDNQVLSNLITQHLSPGLSAEQSAYWFEGLASKNHHALIANDLLWNHLINFIQSLDRDHFMRSLVFLRRTFAQFSLSEKKCIIDKLCQFWSINMKYLNEVVDNALSPYEQSVIDDINQFDFDDI